MSSDEGLLQLLSRCLSSSFALIILTLGKAAGSSDELGFSSEASSKSVPFARWRETSLASFLFPDFLSSFAFWQSLAAFVPASSGEAGSLCASSWLSSGRKPVG